MAQYVAEVNWKRGDQTFTDNRYQRTFTYAFDEGVTLPGSASAHVVPPAFCDEQAVDPEELFVASLSSCHMLWFLAIAARQGYCVDRYQDKACGVMEKVSKAAMAMTQVTLRPQVTFCGDRMPTVEQIDAMHHQAHEACFIANSVKTEVSCEPVYSVV